jgi:hypothetical protein
LFAASGRGSFRFLRPPAAEVCPRCLRPLAAGLLWFVAISARSVSAAFVADWGAAARPLASLGYRAMHCHADATLRRRARQKKQLGLARIAGCDSTLWVAVLQPPSGSSTVGARRCREVTRRRGSGIVAGRRLGGFLDGLRRSWGRNRRRRRGDGRWRRRDGGRRGRCFGRRSRGRRRRCCCTCARGRGDVRRARLAGEQPAYGEEEKEPAAQCGKPKWGFRFFGNWLIVRVGDHSTSVVAIGRGVIVGRSVAHVSAPWRAIA